MRWSHYFAPTMKDVPAEAAIPSHRLMLRAGMIRQASAGIYSWLPLGLRVLRKIEQIVREEQDLAGAHEILMPTIQSADLWRQSGRYDAYGPEMLRIRDRHDRDLLYGPTNEEQVTEMVAAYCRSYRDMPLMLYHIQWKFRDEIRPRFGVMRGREFLMKDNYSFDLDEEGARTAYDKMFVAYLRTFARMGLKAVPFRAETGPIGGALSHEFAILAETGESAVQCDRRLVEAGAPDPMYEDTPALRRFVDERIALYAAADEMQDAERFKNEVAPENRMEARGIEVGHIFNFGTKYSEPLGAVVAKADGSQVPLHMGSYGVGVSRLVGAVIEASHDEAGIIWPEPLTPFDVGLINLKPGDPQCDTLAEQVEAALHGRGLTVLHDDREARAGAKLADMDLIGLPRQVIVGPRHAGSGEVEVKLRATGEQQVLTSEAALNWAQGALAS